MTARCPIVVLISGNGSNLQAIIDACVNDFPVEINAVISNKDDAYGLCRAKQHGIATEVLLASHYSSREEYDGALQQCIDQYQPRLIVLAGFMRILSADFVDHYYGNIINIHPSLLPKYRGLHTHEQVIQHKDSLHGVTIHFVSAVLDGGPIICQAMFEVEADATVADLEQQVHRLEHQMYPMVIAWYATGRLHLEGNSVIFDGAKLTKQGMLLDLH